MIPAMRRLSVAVEQAYHGVLERLDGYSGHNPGNRKYFLHIARLAHPIAHVWTYRPPK